ncbi:MAG TPA: TonB family protein [Bryobacteraceae bacterium]|nr:TonB family protein [Bryobacteraceae bacterium]
MNTRRLLSGILWAAAAYGAQVTRPSIVHKVEPVYSEEARLAKFEGTVLLKVVIGTDGTAHDIQIVRPLALGLDEAAITAVSQWHFKPGEKEGQPVNVVSQIEVNFRLLEKLAWHLSRVEFHLPPGVPRPLIKKVEGPHVADNAPNDTAKLTFDIDESGTPNNIQIENGSADDWARDVTAALRKWKFTPASKDGVAISVPCTMDFVRGN